jgi:hypothetical protein
VGTLEQAIRGLPKVEGEIRVVGHDVKGWNVYGTPIYDSYGEFHLKADAETFATLLRLRQGMG